MAKGDAMSTPPSAPGSSTAAPVLAGKGTTTPWGNVIRLLLAGLPAATAAGVIVAIFLLTGARKPLLESYEKEAKRKVEKKDFSGAIICYERLMRLAPDRADFRFVTALVLEQLGKAEHAEALVRSVAPSNRGGYPPAHLWMARRMVNIFTQMPTSSPLASAAEAHLLRALQGAPSLSEAKLLLGRLYTMLGRPKEALPLLESAPGDQADRLADLARTHAALGDTEAANRFFRLARKSARSQAEATPDDKLAWLLWATVASNAEEYPEALEALERGYKLNGDPAFRRSIASVCSAWSQSLQKAGKDKAGDRLAVIQLGLDQDPANVSLLGQLGDLLSATDETAETARSRLLDALAAGRAPALIHFALGSDDWSREKPDEARIHWEQAHKLDPTMPMVANNLAWLLSHREPTELSRALAIIDAAVAQSPGFARLRGTRGEVLVKMERWKEAVTDLESALSNGEDTSEVHESLAIAYDHLNMREIASRHRKPK